MTSSGVVASNGVGVKSARVLQFVGAPLMLGCWFLTLWVFRSVEVGDMFGIVVLGLGALFLGFTTCTVLIVAYADAVDYVVQATADYKQALKQTHQIRKQRKT